MAEIQFNVNMDLVDKYVPAEDITIPQEDNLSVKFTYSIFNREVAEDLTGVTDIVVSFVKPDGHIVLQSNGALELPNKVNIVANAQAFTYVGKVYMQVQYKKGTQTFNTRQAFFWVEKSGTSCTTVASSDFAPYLDNVIATGEMLNDIDLQALIDSKQTAENAQADVDALTPRVTTLETDVSSLKARVTAVETKNTQQDTRLTSLENQQGTFATNISNLQTSDTTQNTRLANLENGQTTQDNRLTAIETKNATQDTRLTALEATAGDIPTMKTDITAIKGVNTTQDSRLSALETAKTANDSKNATQDTNIGNNATAISGLLTSQTAQDTKIANLEAYQTSSNIRITATETKNTTQDSRLLALEQAQPDLAPINNRLTAVETKNTAQDTRLTDLETAKATNDTKNTQQDSRLTSLENGASSLATTVANNKTAQDTVNTNTNSSLTSLTTRVTATETKNSQQDTRLDAVETKNTSQDTKIATLEGANSVIIADINALETLTGEHESRLDENDTKNASQDSLIASNASAISSLTTTVNNNQTGMNTRVTALETAKTANDTKNTAQDNRLTALENYDVTQDTRMTAIEGVNTTQNTRLTAVETSATNLGNTKVNKAGDTMTGDLQMERGTIEKAYSFLKSGIVTTKILDNDTRTAMYSQDNGETIWRYEKGSKTFEILSATNVVKKAGDTMTGNLSFAFASQIQNLASTGQLVFGNSGIWINDTNGNSVPWQYRFSDKQFIVNAETNLMKKTDYTAKDGRVNLTLTGSATNIDVTNIPPIAIRRGNTVTVRVAARRTSANNDVVVTMPTDMRPTDPLYQTISATDGTTSVLSIGTNGNLFLGDGQAGTPVQNKNFYVLVTYVVD